MLARLSFLSLSALLLSTIAGAAPGRHPRNSKQTIHRDEALRDETKPSFRVVQRAQEPIHFLRARGGVYVVNDRGTSVSELTKSDGAVRALKLEQIFATLPKEHRIVTDLIGGAGPQPDYVVTQSPSDRANLSSLWRVANHSAKRVPMSDDGSIRAWIGTPDQRLVSFDTSGVYGTNGKKVKLPFGGPFDLFTSLTLEDRRPAMLGVVLPSEGQKSRSTFWKGTHVSHPKIGRLPAWVASETTTYKVRPLQMGAYLSIEHGLAVRSKDGERDARLGYQAIFDGQHWREFSLPTGLANARFEAHVEVGDSPLLVERTTDGRTLVSMVDDASVWARPDHRTKWISIFRKSECSIHDVAATDDRVWVIAACGKDGVEHILWSSE